MTVLVSAFIAYANNLYDSRLSNYIKDGKLLLSANIHKIIFIDELIYEHFKEYINDKTKIIKVTKNDMYFYQYKEQIINYSVESNNKAKDTFDYFLIMCSKTEWVKKAIELNIHDNHYDNFIWVDFGIRHVFKCNDSDFVKKIENLENRKYSKLRIASIWNLNTNYSVNPKKIMWFFAGGVFGGDKNSLINFDNETKKMCIEYISNKKTLMWEVNIWYFVYKENSILFEPYYCGHDDSIVDNY